MNAHGIGLGLFICKQIVSQFDGSINVRSEPLVGSKFTFSFRVMNVLPPAPNNTLISATQYDVQEQE